MPSCGATPRYLRERLDLNSGLLVLSHVTVVDVAVGRAKLEMTAIIAGDRIEIVGESGKVPTLDNAPGHRRQGQVFDPGTVGRALSSGARILCELGQGG
jgi:hypothetical protein